MRNYVDIGFYVTYVPENVYVCESFQRSSSCLAAKTYKYAEFCKIC